MQRLKKRLKKTNEGRKINTVRPKTAQTPKVIEDTTRRLVQRVTNGLPHTSKKAKQVYTERFNLI